MKNNPSCVWYIHFYGEKDQRLTKTFTGTVEAVLAHADELEDEVDWQVMNISINRAKEVSS